MRRMRILNISIIVVLFLLTCFRFYKTENLNKQIVALNSKIYEIKRSNDDLLFEQSKRDNVESKIAYSPAWYNYRGKFGIQVGQNWFDVIRNPIYGFEFEGKTYDIATGLSLTLFHCWCSRFGVPTTVQHFPVEGFIMKIGAPVFIFVLVGIGIFWYILVMPRLGFNSPEYTKNPPLTSVICITAMKVVQ